MRASVMAADGKANFGPGQLAGRKSETRPVGRQFPTLIARFRAIFPRKTASELAARTGNGIRAAERWLAGAREMSAEALLKLIVSDKGGDLLAALANELPRGQRAIFWARIHRLSRDAVRRERLRQLQEELEQDDQPDLLSPRARSDIRRR